MSDSVVTLARLVVVGDVIDDIVVIPRGPILADTDTSAAISRSAGGSGANTAAWLGHLGCAVDFVGALGADGAEFHARALRDAGVTPHLVVVPDAPTGTIVIIVEGERRTMLTERGANDRLSTRDVPDALFESATALYVSGYSVTGALGIEGARDLMTRARRARVSVALGSGSVGFLAELGPEKFRTLLSTADLFLVNRAEGALLTGQQEPTEIVMDLLRDVPLVVLTLGERGALIASRRDGVMSIPVEPVDLVDPTGAGDAFAAGFLSNWISSMDLERAGRAGAVVAAQAVTNPGARPTTVANLRAGTRPLTD